MPQKWTKHEDGVTPVQEIGGYITVGYAARLLGVNTYRILHLINNGTLQAIPLGEPKANGKTQRPFWLIDKDSVNAARDKRENNQD